MFRWMNTVLGNLKTSLSGAYHSFGFSEYAERYLGASAYRSNRRFDLHALPNRLLVAAALCGSAPLNEFGRLKHIANQVTPYLLLFTAVTAISVTRGSIGFKPRLRRARQG